MQNYYILDYTGSQEIKLSISSRYDENLQGKTILLLIREIIANILYEQIFTASYKFMKLLTDWS